MAELPGPTRVAYEAGATGYGRARAAHGGDRMRGGGRRGRSSGRCGTSSKTDQRDAERVRGLLMIDALHAVRVATVEEEAIRDLVRAREDLRGDLMRSRQRLSKLLLRHGIVDEDTSSAWTAEHRAWLQAQDLGGGAQATLLDYLGAIDTLVLRREQLEATIAQLVPSSPYAQPVARLRCRRGIDTLSAVGLAAEIGDFARLERPGQLMSYLGLVPSESSSGETRRQGKITRTGSKHARRLLVEAAWHYHKTPARGVTLQRRQADQPAAVVAISWQAQRRLHHVWRRLADQRGKRRTIVAVAVARQLTAFCWAIATHNTGDSLGPRPGRHRQGPCRRATPHARSPQPRSTEQTQGSVTDIPPHDTRLRRRRNPPGSHAREHPRANGEQPPRSAAATLGVRQRALTTKPGPAVAIRYESRC